MRVVNSFFETLIDYDLNKGYLVDSIALKEEAELKTEWNDDDYEEVKMYVEYSKKDLAPSQLDVIEAQITYTAMMTDTLLEE